MVVLGTHTARYVGSTLRKTICENQSCHMKNSMNKNDLLFFLLVLGMFSIFSIFDIDERGQLAIYILVAGGYLSHKQEEREEKRIEIIMKQNERLDALELQQHKQRDANRRIAKLEDEVKKLIE